MDPRITNLSNERGEMRFQLSSANVSFANALRRTALADIPVAVLDAAQAVFQHNTTRLNNEILKQRLDCIPPHLNDEGFPVTEHEIRLDLVNNTGATRLVTTKDFQIVQKATGLVLPDSERAAIFPPDPISGDHILFARLRAKVGAGQEGGERLAFRCPLAIRTAAGNGCYTCVSVCSYGATADVQAAETAWKSKQEDGTSKADWQALGAQRYVVPDSFDFVLRSVGALDNRFIMRKACAVLSEGLIALKTQLQEDGDAIVKPFGGTVENCYELTVPGLGYTRGKALEAALHLEHVPSILTYCGFRKPHPHIDESVLRVAFVEPPGEARGTAAVVSLLGAACGQVAAMFDGLGKQFT